MTCLAAFLVLLFQECRGEWQKKRQEIVLLDVKGQLLELTQAASTKLIMAKQVYDKKMNSGSISFNARW